MITEERGYMTHIAHIIPDNAKHIVFEFNRYGYKTYFVGGCVRDIILGRTPHDWDICTEATPDNIENLVAIMVQHEYGMEHHGIHKGKPYIRREIKSIPTGLQHGTLTIMIDNEAYEVTTFRCDGEYSDNRRPDNVTFTKNLDDDLARRDFTINAIAFSQFLGFIDPFNGMSDIENQIIRCVGNPNERFNEDGLRILRAIRFAAQLGFTIEEETSKAIHENKHLLKNISRERIQSELFKILSSDGCGNAVLREYSDVLCVCIPEIEPMIGFQQNNPWHCFDVWEHTLHCMDFLSNQPNEYDDIITRLAILFHDIGKPHCYIEDEQHIGHFYGHASTSTSLTEDILRGLKCSNDIINSVCELVASHDVQFTSTKSAVKRLLNKLGETQLRRLFLVRMCDITGQNPTAVDLNDRQLKVICMFSILNNIIQENECFQLKDLAINGKDLINHGIPEGKTIGIILNTLLTMVIDGEVENEKSKLLEMTDLIISQNIVKEY